MREANPELPLAFVYILEAAGLVNREPRRYTKIAECHEVRRLIRAALADDFAAVREILQETSFFFSKDSVYEGYNDTNQCDQGETIAKCDVSTKIRTGIFGNDANVGEMVAERAQLALNMLDLELVNELIGYFRIKYIAELSKDRLVAVYNEETGEHDEEYTDELLEEGSDALKNILEELDEDDEDVKHIFFMITPRTAEEQDCALDDEVFAPESPNRRDSEAEGSGADSESSGSESGSDSEGEDSDTKRSNFADSCLHFSSQESNVSRVSTVKESAKEMEESAPVEEPVADVPADAEAAPVAAVEEHMEEVVEAASAVETAVTVLSEMAAPAPDAEETDAKADNTPASVSMLLATSSATTAAELIAQTEAAVQVQAQFQALADSDTESDDEVDPAVTPRGVNKDNVMEYINALPPSTRISAVERLYHKENIRWTFGEYSTLKHKLFAQKAAVEAQAKRRAAEKEKEKADKGKEVIMVDTVEPAMNPVAAAVAEASKKFYFSVHGVKPDEASSQGQRQWRIIWSSWRKDKSVTREETREKLASEPGAMTPRDWAVLGALISKAKKSDGRVRNGNCGSPMSTPSSAASSSSSAKRPLSEVASPSPATPAKRVKTATPVKRVKTVTPVASPVAALADKVADFGLAPARAPAPAPASAPAPMSKYKVINDLYDQMHAVIARDPFDPNVEKYGKLIDAHLVRLERLSALEAAERAAPK